MIKKFLLAVILLFSIYNVSATFVAPASYHSYDDVLLVCNNASSISMQICDYFQANRSIINRVNLTGIVETESVNSTQYLSILSQVNASIVASSNQINYIVTTKGVPIMSTYRQSNGAYSVDSMLTSDILTFKQTYLSKEEAFNSSKYGFYIVTRLDGYNWNDIKGLIDRAASATNAGYQRDRTLNNTINDSWIVVDDTNYAGVGSTYFSSTNTTLAGQGFNSYYVSGATSTFVRNFSYPVIGYVSWGSNDASFWQTSSMTNYGFDSWTNNVTVNNWTLISGNYSYYPSAVLFNITGLNTIQNSINITQPKENVMLLYYNYTNFAGTVYSNITSYNSSGAAIAQSYYLIVNKTALTNQTSTQSYGAQKILRNSSIASLGVELQVNLLNGSFLTTGMEIRAIAPYFNWTDGAISGQAVSFGARSFNDTTYYGQSLAGDLINDGVTGTEAYVTEPYLGAIPDTSVLFDRYLGGFNLGDSYYMASSNLNWKDIVIGDPKMTIFNNTYPHDNPVIVPPASPPATNSYYFWAGALSATFTLTDEDGLGAFYINTSLDKLNMTSSGALSSIAYITPGNYSVMIYAYDIFGVNATPYNYSYSIVQGEPYTYAYVGPVVQEYNNETYVSCSCDGDGILQMYVNGVLNATGYSELNLTSRFLPGQHNLTCYHLATVDYPFESYEQLFEVNDSYSPVIQTITSYSITQTSAIINWTVNELVNSSVIITNSSGSIVFNCSNSTKATSGSCTITSLTASSTYNINLTVCDYGPNCVSNNSLNITTLSDTVLSGGGGSSTEEVVEEDKTPETDTLQSLGTFLWPAAPTAAIVIVSGGIFVVAFVYYSKAGALAAAT